MSHPISIRFGVSFCGILFSGLAQAQVPYEQAQAECQSIAQQQAGASTSYQQPAAGGRARGAAAGAMAGAAKAKSKTNQYGNVSDEVAEEYTRNQMQEAAKMGMAAGAAKQRQQRRQDQQQGGPSDTYNQAFNACMASKGYGF